MATGTMVSPRASRGGSRRPADVSFVRSTLDGTCDDDIRVGFAGTIELTPIFPGSQVDFGVRIGMQEQGAASLADLSSLFVSQVRSVFYF